MECRITKDELLEALYLAQGIADRRVTLPVLAHVLIHVGPREVEVLATDQEIGLRRKCTISSGKRGSATANARVFYDIVRSLGEGDIELSVNERNQLDIRQGKAQFRILGVDPEEFPAMPASAGAASKGALAIDAEVLRRMLELTLFAASSDEARPALCGVYLERRDGALHLVASDGHRLSLVKRALKGVRPEGGVILSRKAVNEMMKVLDAASGEVQLAFGTGVVFLTAGDVELAMRTVQADFPSYDAVIREESPLVARISNGQWNQSLRRVALVAEEQNHGVRFSFSPGKLELSAKNPGLGEAREDLDVDYSGDAFSIGFNAKYILEVLNLLAPDHVVEVGMLDDESPTLLRSPEEPDFLYVVMPMRLPGEYRGNV
ncbi:MAG: DNA polymerase III subunit beta [Candidatus Binatia bacterium]|nr:MAG: DNA polymerase III subunit beta [Candidatus Binatia bacterium]